MAKGSNEASKTGRHYGVINERKWLLFGPRVVAGAETIAEAKATRDRIVAQLRLRGKNEQADAIIVGEKKNGRWVPVKEGEK
jgi:hypothetical protein